MAQYQHLPIYKVTYDLLVKTTEVTRHFPRDFKTFATRLREEMIDIVLLIYRANSDRAERARLLTVIVERMQAIELSLNSYLGLLRHTAGWRHRQALAKAARAQGLRVNAALTKAIPTTPTAASTLPHLVTA